MYVDNNLMRYDGGGAVRQENSPNQSSGIVPKGVIIHWTGARLDFEKPINWLCNKKAKASAHFVIGQNPDEIAQLVPLDKKSWHAGRSRYDVDEHSYIGLNKWTYGIELVNSGKLVKKANGRFTTRLGEMVLADEVIEWNGGYYQEYTPWQIDTVYEVCEALIDAYPDIHFIAGHNDICIPRGRKKDPGHFPMDTMESWLFGRLDK